MQPSHGEPPDLADLIDITAAAKLMRCHVASLYRWLAAGRLRSWRRVGRRFVLRSELVGLLVPVLPPAPAPRQPTAAQVDRQTQATLNRIWPNRPR